MPSLKRLRDTCLVEVSTQPSDKGGKKQENSCSGILVNQKHGYILTQATVLLSALSANANLAEKLFNSGKLSGTYFHNLLVTVLLEHQPAQAPTSEGPDAGNDVKYSTALLNVTSGSFPSSGKTEKWAGEVSWVWKMEEFEEQLTSLFPKSDGWKFVDESVEKEKKSGKDKDKDKENQESDSERISSLLPYFVLIKLHNWKSRNWQTSVTPSQKLRVGQEVFAVGTPFGNLSPPVFLNSVSRGIVCNVAGRNNALILTDARCIPGSEGGAVYYGEYSPNRLQLAAVIVAPLCWKSNEWIGLTICCSLSSVLESLEHVANHLDDNNSSAILGNNIANVKGCTVQPPKIWFIKNGGSFGTGVLISERHGLILTCSHVVKSTDTVMVRDDSMEWYNAEVIYATPNGKVFDLALLKLGKWNPGCDDSTRSNLVEIAYDFQEGDPVRMVGHAVFDRNHQMAPSVTEGIVARVVHVGAHPVLLQSTCAVHCGASGGPLLAEDGRLLSIVTCNARDTKSGASYPHVNMSVPLKTVWPVIQRYVVTKDVKVLDQLHLQSSDVENLWQLQLKESQSQLRSQL